MCGSFFLLALHCVSTNDWRWIGWMDHKAIHTRPPHHLHHRHRHHHHIIIIHHPSICPFVRPIYSPSLPGHVLSRSRSMFFFDLRFFFGVPFSRDRVLLSFFVFISFFLSHLHLHLHFAFIHVLSPPLQTLDNFCSRLFQIPVHSILIVSNPHLHRIHTIQAHIRFVFFSPFSMHIIMKQGNLQYHSFCQGYHVHVRIACMERGVSSRGCENQRDSTLFKTEEAGRAVRSCALKTKHVRT